MCLTQATLGFPESESYYGYQPGFYQAAGAGSNVGTYPMRPEDESAIQELGPEAIETGKRALNIATRLVQDVFPREGPIVRNGAIQTKWGNYALPLRQNNPDDIEIIDMLLQATREMIQRIPIIE